MAATRKGSSEVNTRAPDDTDNASGASPTLDDLFRRTVARKPDAQALADPANKQRVTGQPQLRLTYAQADRAVSALAAKFIDSGVPAGSIVALQLPGTVEFPIAVLAAIRAGMTVALLPQLWRQAELTAALNRTGARAVVSIGRIELVDHAELALNAAAEVFSIRQVFGFGRNLPDGMMPLDIVTDDATETAFPQLDPKRPAIVSFDVTADGMCVVPRSHVQLIAGGLALLLESGFPPGAKILSTCAPSSFGGIAASMMTWLLSGGLLSLHHAGDMTALEMQIAAPGHDVLVIPAPLALPLAKAGAFSEPATLKHIIGLWRSPEQMAASDIWPERNASLTDVLLFGEIGLVAAKRLQDGTPAPINLGIQHSPRASSEARAVGELLITPAGKLGMQGVMVPVNAYQRPKHDDSYGEPLAYADTGYGARHHRAANTVEITSPPGAMVAVGGYRFLGQELESWSKRLGDDTMLAALPDQFNGHRLAGRAADPRRVREVLAELGLNPLMAGAFRNRTDPA